MRSSRVQPKHPESDPVDDAVRAGDAPDAEVAPEAPEEPGDGVVDEQEVVTPEDGEADENDATPGDADDAIATDNPGAQDAEWVRQCLAGDADGFERLVEKYQRQAVVVSYRLLGNHDDARDITQDAFVKAYRSLDTLERPAAFGGWLMRIVTNLSLNYRRGRRLRIAQTLDGPVADTLGNAAGGERPMRGHGSDSLAQSGDPRHAAEGRELGEALQNALHQLPEKQRQALVLFTIQEMPQKDVADTLGCSVEAVKWHVFQGRKRLKELLKDAM